MKVKDFKINVVVDEYGKRTPMTVENNTTIKTLREQMNLPENYEIYFGGQRAPDGAILEDGDLVEIKYDILTILDRMQKDIVEFRELVKEII